MALTHPTYNSLQTLINIFSRYCEYARNATFETICIRDDEERHALTNIDLHGNGTEALERLNTLMVEFRGNQREEKPKTDINFDVHIEPPTRSG